MVQATKIVMAADSQQQLNRFALAIFDRGW
jgi:hypothetical protein